MGRTDSTRETLHVLRLSCSGDKVSRKVATEPNIQALFARLAHGDKEAFNRLFRLKYPVLLSFAESYLGRTGTAEEVVSDLFTWLWMNREQAGEINSPETYLFKSVKNRSLNALRDAAKIIPLDEQSMPTRRGADSTPLSLMEQEELSAILHTLVNNLPSQQKQVFKMIKEGGLSARQVAEVLQLSPRTVETHLYKAVKKLEEEIARYLGYSPRGRQAKKLLLLLW